MSKGEDSRKEGKKAAKKLKKAGKEFSITIPSH